MGRPKKTEEIEPAIPETEEQTITETEEIEPEQETRLQEELPKNVISAMRHYPQYEEMWITPRGFVHPAGVPQYLIKGAKLYKNHFYNK